MSRIHHGLGTAMVFIIGLGLASCDDAAGIEGSWYGQGFEGFGFGQHARTFSFKITSCSIETDAQFIGNMERNRPVRVTYEADPNGWIHVILADGSRTDAAFKVIDRTHIVFEGAAVAGQINLQKNGA